MDTYSYLRRLHRNRGSPRYRAMAYQRRYPQTYRRTRRATTWYGRALQRLTDARGNVTRHTMPYVKRHYHRIRGYASRYAARYMPYLKRAYHAGRGYFSRYVSGPAASRLQSVRDAAYTSRFMHRYDPTLWYRNRRTTPYVHYNAMYGGPNYDPVRNAVGTAAELYYPALGGYAAESAYDLGTAIGKYWTDAAAANAYADEYARNIGTAGGTSGQRIYRRSYEPPPEPNFGQRVLRRLRQTLAGDSTATAPTPDNDTEPYLVAHGVNWGRASNVMRRLGLVDDADEPPSLDNVAILDHGNGEHAAPQTGSVVLPSTPAAPTQ